MNTATRHGGHRRLLSGWKSAMAALRPRRAVVLAGALLLATLAVPAAADATPHDAPGLTHVRGKATVIDQEAGTLRLQGGLLGTLYTTKLEIVLESPVMDVQLGTERIEGCLDKNRDGRCGKREPTGKLFTEFVYWATFDPDTGRLIRGQCAHPIIRGSGDFAGTRGLITFDDRQVGQEVLTTYEGDLVLEAVSEGAGAGSGSAAGSSSGTVAPAALSDPFAGGC